ncbi:MAG: glycosyltransferase family 4 protein, partial [Anaerolineae bacterium]|nr:glycosyltransferase family 4 protein [Anaerolineae bacterium]
VIVYRLKASVLPALPIALNFPWLNLTFRPANLRRVTAILEEHCPDILHLHNHMFDLGLVAARMRKQFKIPMVTTVHTIIRHSNPLYNLVLLPADRVLLKKLVIDKSDRLICPDFNVSRYVQEIFHRAGTTIVPYGIETLTNFDLERVEELRDLHQLHQKRVILSIGHVHEIRNRHDLIAAMPAILKKAPDTVILIVGALSTKSPLNLAKSLGVDYAVLFTGPVAHTDIVNYLALADMEAHWLNQEEPERTSLGIASLEAMLAGKVVLAAANPDTYGPGLLKNGENIIIVRPGEPDQLAQTIVGLMLDENRRREIGQRARESIAEQFSWDSVSNQTLQVYRKTLAQ